MRLNLVLIFVHLLMGSLHFRDQLSFVLSRIDIVDAPWTIFHYWSTLPDGQRPNVRTRLEQDITVVSLLSRALVVDWLRLIRRIMTWCGKTNAVKVAPIGGGGKSLTESLQPLWVTTFYLGFLPDWCVAVVRRKFTLVVNWTATLCVMVILLIMALNQSVQLFIQYQTSSNIHSMMLNVMWFFVYLTGSIIYLFVMFNRKQFISFFDQWQRMELKIPSRHLVICSTRNGCKIIYGFYLFMCSFFALSLIPFVISTPTATVLLSHYDVVRQFVPFPVIIAVHLMASIFVNLSATLSEVVPSFTFYHAAMTVRALEQQIKHSLCFVFVARGQCKELRTDARPVLLAIEGSTCDQSTAEGELLAIWGHYEEIRRLVTRANNLLGFLTLIAHSFAFVIITCLTYSVLYNFKTIESVELVRYTMFALIFLVRLVLGVLSKDQLQRSCRQLTTTLAELLGDHWRFLSDNERQILTALCNRLQDHPLSASPWDLYNVKRSLLLQMLSLSVGYIVILLQS